MGGVDYHDQLRQCYGLDRRSKKWWHRIFWAALEITFINSYSLAKRLFPDENYSLLSYRRDITRGLMALGDRKFRMRSLAPKRRFNYSVPDTIRLSNRGNHWPIFSERRGRCEICSSKNIQSKPLSMCSLCHVYLCVNASKNITTFQRKQESRYILLHVTEFAKGSSIVLPAAFTV
jgi:DDE_Tnp_1-like zinc-ribbon/Transposase IS4